MIHCLRKIYNRLIAICASGTGAYVPSHESIPVARWTVCGCAESSGVMCQSVPCGPAVESHASRPKSHEFTSTPCNAVKHFVVVVSAALSMCLLPLARRSCSFEAVGVKTCESAESRVGPASECERRPTNRSSANGGPARLSCRLSHPTSNIIKKTPYKLSL